MNKVKNHLRLTFSTYNFAKLLLSQVVETVIACRGAGIIHRDIKVGDNFFSSRFVAKVGECG